MRKVAFLVAPLVLFAGSSCSDDEGYTCTLTIRDNMTDAVVDTDRLEYTQDEAGSADEAIALCEAEAGDRVAGMNQRYNCSCKSN